MYDGTDHPETRAFEVTGLELDKYYRFFVTGLNPYESEPSETVIYRAAGRPSVV